METYAVNKNARRLMDETFLAACEMAASDSVLVASDPQAARPALGIAILPLHLARTCLYPCR